MTRAAFDEIVKRARDGQLSALALGLLQDIIATVDQGTELPVRPEWAARRGCSLRTLERALQELTRAGVVSCIRAGKGPAMFVVEVDEGVAVNRQSGGSGVAVDRHFDIIESEGPMAVNRHFGGLKAQRDGGDIHTRGRAAKPAPAAAPPATPSPDGGDPPSVSGASAADLHPGLSDQAFVVERMRRAGRRVNPDLYPRFARWFADGATREDVLYAFQEAAMHRPAAYVAYVEEVVGRCIAARLEAAAGVPAPVIVLDHYRRAGGGA